MAWAISLAAIEIPRFLRISIVACTAVCPLPCAVRKEMLQRVEWQLIEQPLACGVSSARPCCASIPCGAWKVPWALLEAVPA